MKTKTRKDLEYTLDFLKGEIIEIENELKNENPSKFRKDFLEFKLRYVKSRIGEVQNSLLNF